MRPAIPFTSSFCVWVSVLLMLALLPPCNSMAAEACIHLLFIDCDYYSKYLALRSPASRGCHNMQALMESIFICGGGSAVPGVGPKLLQSISAHLPPSAQPVLCPVPEYMPEHAGTTAEPPASCSKSSCPSDLMRNKLTNVCGDIIGKVHAGSLYQVPLDG